MPQLNASWSELFAFDVSLCLASDHSHLQPRRGVKHVCCSVEETILPVPILCRSHGGECGVYPTRKPLNPTTIPNITEKKGSTNQAQMVGLFLHLPCQSLYWNVLHQTAKASRVHYFRIRHSLESQQSWAMLR